MLKEIKNKKLNILDALVIVPDYKLVNGFYEYLELLNNQTKVKTKKLYNAAIIYEDNGITAAIDYLIKQKLVK